MKREKVILSDLDLRILEFIKRERFISDLFYNFDMNYSMINLHLNRLRSLRCFCEKKFGNFKKININKRGHHILSILNNGV